jgi:hypothetical protein
VRRGRRSRRRLEVARQLLLQTMLRVSPDGECHVCTSTLPLCIYLPSRV